MEIRLHNAAVCASEPQARGTRGLAEIRTTRPPPRATEALQHGIGPGVACAGAFKTPVPRCAPVARHHPPESAALADNVPRLTLCRSDFVTMIAVTSLNRVSGLSAMVNVQLLLVVARRANPPETC
jgi:hypothetical protein